jgi:signal transduction histidine kinase
MGDGKILVIEDEAAILNNILEMLELEGFEVIGAENGLAGVRRAREHKPDLIICDITMPELDGYEVLVLLRSDPATVAIPFIFLTARADRPFMRHGMELGADDYLTKPFSLGELRSAVASRLERHQAILDATHKDLDQAKRTLIQLVAHELRTPLVSISAVTDILSRQSGNLSGGQLRELLDTLERGSQRLNRVVEQVILIIQLETGTLSQESIRQNGMPIQPSDLLIASVDLARRFAYHQPDVSIKVDERDRDLAILGDIRALRHALAELITNALSFSPQGDQVSVAQWQADGRAWISIVDRGPGIPPDRLEQALKAFHQIERETREQQGIGLGLTLAKQVVEAHGGAFEINSVVDRGTQITVGLPVMSESPH